MDESLSVSKAQPKDSLNDDKLSATPKRKRRDSSMNDDVRSSDNDEKPLKSLRIEQAFQKPHTRCALHIRDLVQESSPTEVQQVQTDDQLNESQADKEILTDKQKEFVHQWCEAFAQRSSESTTSHECLNALATLIQARPQYIYEYISKKYNDLTREHLDTQKPISDITQDRQLSSPTEPYTLTKSNEHLPPETLILVEKYISTCHRRRPQTDGRRTVNSGPFRCTFGCGYRTKRAFDWRRHEETHEPQELWLCTLCCHIKDDAQTQEDLHSQNTFMVSRKDKFLRHVKDAHQKWVPEKVLEMSRVGYKPRVGGKCEICEERWDSWEERCKHVLGHFEDEGERSNRREDGWDNVDKGGPLESASSEAGDNGD